ncbi:hypothetical protein Tco_0744061 [Tanacetum coccineum]
MRNSPDFCLVDSPICVYEQDFVLNSHLEVAFDLLRDALSAIFGLSELKLSVADSTVTYSSVHSKAGSWSIPSEEAARQLLEQAPRSPEYVPEDQCTQPGCEIGESSAAAVRQSGPTMETRLRDTERRIMTALELVNRRVTYQVGVCTRESSEFCTRHHDAQKDRAAVRAEIERQAVDDLAVQHIMRTQALEAGARVDTLEDTGSSS